MLASCPVGTLPDFAAIDLRSVRLPHAWPHLLPPEYVARRSSAHNRERLHARRSFAKGPAGMGLPIHNPVVPRITMNLSISLIGEMANAMSDEKAAAAGRAIVPATATRPQSPARMRRTSAATTKVYEGRWASRTIRMRHTSETAFSAPSGLRSPPATLLAHLRCGRETAARRSAARSQSRRSVTW